MTKLLVVQPAGVVFASLKPPLSCRVANRALLTFVVKKRIAQRHSPLGHRKRVCQENLDWVLKPQTLSGRFKCSGMIGLGVPAAGGVAFLAIANETAGLDIIRP